MSNTLIKTRYVNIQRLIAIPTICTSEEQSVHKYFDSVIPELPENIPFKLYLRPVLINAGSLTPPKISLSVFVGGDEIFLPPEGVHFDMMISSDYDKKMVVKKYPEITSDASYPSYSMIISTDIEFRIVCDTLI